MNHSFPLLAVVIGCASLTADLTAQHEGEHYVRHAESVDQSSASVDQIAIASDEELTLLLYRQASPSHQLYTVAADGRALGDGYGVPQLVSGASGDLRSIQRDSIHVVGKEGFAVWADDAAGAASTRLWTNRHKGGTWETPAAIPGFGLLNGLDLKCSATAVASGLSSRATIAVLACYESTGSDRLFLHLSTNGGQTFEAPIEVSSTGAAPGSVGAVDIELAGPSIHCSWTDDRGGSQDVYYRSALIGPFGGVVWNAADAQLSNGIGSSAQDSVVLAVNGEGSWTGADAKYVGVSWLQDEGDGLGTLRTAVSHSYGDSFFPSAVVAHTGDVGVDVASYDFEITGHTFQFAWEDQSTGGRQVFLLTSDEGTVLDGSAGSFLAQVSGQNDPGSVGFNPGITRSAKTPFASCIYWTEIDLNDNIRVVSAFADQSLGGEFHAEYPEVSEGSEVDESEFGPVVGAYNFRYNNFALAWLELDVVSGLQNAWAGGYRPQAAELEEFTPSSPDAHFFIEHIPFEDLYGFVLMSRSATTGPGFLLPDGRRTGLVRDNLTNFGLQNFSNFIGPNVSAEEGAETPHFPTTNVTVGTTIYYVGVSINPFGDINVLTDVFSETFE